MKRILKFFIVLAILLFNGVNVSASTSGKVKYTSSQYVVKSGAYFSGIRIMVDIGGKLNAAYCVSPGINIENNTSYTGVSSDKYSELSSDKKRKIELIAYFGYGYNDQNSDLWQSVTQALIWEVILGKEVYIEDKYTSKRIDFSHEKSTILREVANYDSSIKFNPNKVEMYQDETVNITISGNDLGRYSPAISNNHKIIGSELNIWKNKLYFKKEFFKNTKTSSGETLYFKRSGYQDLLVSNRTISSKTEVLEVNVLDYSRIKVIKTGSDDKLLEGVSFSIYLDSNGDKIVDYNYKLVDEGITDMNGELIFDNLHSGDYIVVETLGIEGYVISEDYYNVSIGNSEEVEVSVVNQLIENKIIISKIDKETGENVSGALLSIYQSDEQLFTWESSDEAKEIILSYGSYTLCEDRAPINYSKSEECIKIDVLENELIQEINFENERVLVRTGVKSMTIFPVVTLGALLLIKIKRKH